LIEWLAAVLMDVELQYSVISSIINDTLTPALLGRRGK
jgi:hypothetical protein